MMKTRFLKNYVLVQLGTSIHKWYVFKYLFKFCFKILYRAIVHDLSKYGNYEAFRLTSNNINLKNILYGSREYVDNIQNSLRDFAQHHYRLNRHHPEYHKNGYNDMSAIDKIEMIADWLAATKRTKDGNIKDSILINQDRFKYSNIDISLLNTIAQDML